MLTEHASSAKEMVWVARVMADILAIVHKISLLFCLATEISLTITMLLCYSCSDLRTLNVLEKEYLSFTLLRSLAAPCVTATVHNAGYMIQALSTARSLYKM